MNATTQIWVFAPDMTFNMDWDEASDQIKETFFHEFAHASHFQNVPNSYWVDNIAYVVENEVNNNNSPYGTLETPGSGRTGVIELWGWHYGPTLADRMYGLEHSNSVDLNQTMDERRHLNILENTRDVWTGVVPVGVCHDLIDVNPLTGGYEHPLIINDVISGFSHSELFNILDGDILSPVDFRNALHDQAPSGQTNNQTDALFNDYGF